MLSVKLFSAKNLYCVYQELDFLHGNAALHEPVDIHPEHPSRALELKCQSWNDSGIWHFEE